MRSRQPAGRRRYSRFSAACKTQCLLAIVGTAAVPFPTRVDRTGREFSGLTWNPSITLEAGCQHYGNEREKAAAHLTGWVPLFGTCPPDPQAMMKRATNRVGI